MKLSEAAFLITHNDDVHGKYECICGAADDFPELLEKVKMAVLCGKDVEILPLDEAVSKFMGN